MVYADSQKKFHSTLRFILQDGLTPPKFDIDTHTNAKNHGLENKYLPSNMATLGFNSLNFKGLLVASFQIHLDRQVTSQQKVDLPA